jgi:hypothetical protein
MAIGGLPVPGSVAAAWEDVEEPDELDELDEPQAVSPTSVTAAVAQIQAEVFTARR